MSHRPGFQIAATRIVEHGKVRLEFDNPAKYRALLERLQVDRVTVTIEREVKRRSNKQNAWVWGCAYELMLADSGYEVNEMKEAKEALHYSLVKKCFGTRYDERLKDDVPNVTRSSQLETQEFTYYMGWLQRHAAMEWNVILPDPDKEWMFNKQHAA